MARTSHDAALSGSIRDQLGASLPLDQVEYAARDPVSRTGKVGPNQSELLHQAVKRLAGAPQVVGKADHPTGLDRHNEYDAITTMACSVV